MTVGVRVRSCPRHSDGETLSLRARASAEVVAFADTLRAKGVTLRGSWAMGDFHVGLTTLGEVQSWSDVDLVAGERAVDPDWAYQAPSFLFKVSFKESAVEWGPDTLIRDSNDVALATLALALDVAVSAHHRAYATAKCLLLLLGRRIDDRYLDGPHWQNSVRQPLVCIKLGCETDMAQNAVDSAIGLLQPARARSVTRLLDDSDFSAERVAVLDSVMVNERLHPITREYFGSRAR